MFDLKRKLNFKILKSQFFKKYKKYRLKEKKYENWLKEFNHDEERGLYTIEMFDVIDNDNMNKLIRKLYKLNKYKFIDVENSYRKNFMTKSIYAKVQIDYTSIGRLAEIKFKDDGFIRNILVSHTQINNNEFIISYKFILKKVIRNYLEISSIVYKNIDFIKHSCNCTWYLDKKFFGNLEDYKDMIRLDINLFRDYFQCFIEKRLHTTIGKKYKLPVVFNYNILDENSSKKELKKSFLTKCYSNKEETEFLNIDITESEGASINRYTFGKYLNSNGLLHYFSEYGNEFYFQIFNRIEAIEIERRLGRYFSNKKKYISLSDQKWLINKIRGIKERKVVRNSKFGNKLFVYKDGIITEEELINYPEYSEKYLKIYTEYLEYIKSINTIRYNTIILCVTIVTLILTFSGVIISILAYRSQH